MTDAFPKVSVSSEYCKYSICPSDHIHYLFDGSDEPLYITLGSIDDPVRLTGPVSESQNGYIVQHLTTKNNRELKKLVHIIDSMQEMQKEHKYPMNRDFSIILQPQSGNNVYHLNFYLVYFISIYNAHHLPKSLCFGKTVWIGEMFV